MRILIVEDDVPLARRIASALAEVGHDLIIAHDGERALDAATQTSFDLIVLDIILPGIDGFEVLTRLHSRHLSSRVLIVTARGDVKDRIAGLQLGADDYLPKPFAMRELVARVNALGRRYPAEPALNLRAADLELDVVNHQVYRGGRRIELSPRELMLLKVLLREPGRVFTRTELCESVWEHKHEADAKLIEVFIGRLRQKIGDPPLIHTVRHVGYTIDSRPVPLRQHN
jgi:DNA-binding response OmpR family regulator